MAFAPDPAVEAELSHLEGLSLDGLRDLWRKRLGTAPKHQSAELLRRRLAYELQVRAYGELKPEIRRKVQRLYSAFSRTDGFAPLPTLSLSAGAILTKRWKGQVHTVAVLDVGFEYGGQKYKSLSQIAELITGSKRSGPAFFGFGELPR